MGLPERTNEAAGAYAKACVDVAGECGGPVVDIWTKMQHISDWPRICLRYFRVFNLQFTHNLEALSCRDVFSLNHATGYVDYIAHNH